MLAACGFASQLASRVDLGASAVAEEPVTYGGVTLADAEEAAARGLSERLVMQNMEARG